MAEAHHIGHFGLGSNFQPNPVSNGQWHILKFVFKAKIANFTVIHLWHASCLYIVCMHSQFLHHTLITCTLHAALVPFLHMLTYF